MRAFSNKSKLQWIGFGLLFCIPLLIFLLLREVSIEDRLISAARSLDEGRVLTSHPACGATLNSITPEDRTVRMGDSINLSAVFSISEGPCTLSVSLNAAAFSISPSGVQEFELDDGIETIVWNVFAEKIGTHSIFIQSGLRTFAIGVSVRSPLYLSRTQLAILTLLASIFGPALTLPFWIKIFVETRKQDE